MKVEICVRTLGMHYVIDCPHKDGRADKFVCVSEWVDGGAGGGVS